MSTWVDILRAGAATLPPESPIVISVQWLPGLDMLDPAYVPAQDIYTTAGAIVTGQFPPVEVPPGPPIERMTVDKAKLNGAQALNIRAAPGTSKEAIGKVLPGQALEVRGSALANGYHWAELLSVDGVAQAGYVAREYLRAIGV